jgi:hypothetical protein
MPRKKAGNNESQKVLEFQTAEQKINQLKQDLVENNTALAECDNNIDKAKAQVNKYKNERKELVIDNKRILQQLKEKGHIQLNFDLVDLEDQAPEDEEENLETAFTEEGEPEDTPEEETEPSDDEEQEDEENDENNEDDASEPEDPELWELINSVNGESMGEFIANGCPEEGRNYSFPEDLNPDGHYHSFDVGEYEWVNKEKKYVVNVTPHLSPTNGGESEEVA